MRARLVVTMLASTMVAVQPLAAQKARDAWPPLASLTEAAPRATLSAAMVRPERAASRGGHMFLGGSVGLLLGAAYSGVRVGSGNEEARKRVFVPPLLGVALGAAAGALWFEVTRARR